MMSTIPNTLAIAFGLVTLLTVLLLWFAVYKSESQRSKAKWVILVSVLWLGIQAFLSLKGFYSTDLAANPPKLPFGFMPPLIFTVVLLFSKRGKAFVDGLPTSWVTFISVVRIPVEFALYYLFLYKAIPELMTFEGRNFDIIAGITAPVVAYYGWYKGKLGKGLLWAWNLVSIALLVNIVTNAILAAPFSFQQQAFDQPNLAVLHFPFIWLPTYIVPVVFLSHFIQIRHLLKFRD